VKRPPRTGTTLMREVMPLSLVGFGLDDAAMAFP
jgi:hypothetical protein